ncbi:MAG TPA: ComF family protein [Bacteroidota bacterium]|nr:ComF family protein [Bacteroidota bacterium]
MNPSLWSLLTPLRDFIYPPVCFVCDNSLARNEDRICTACWGSFTIIDPLHPTWIEVKEKVQAEGTIDELLSCFLFEKEGALQDVLHLLKYRGMRSLGARLGLEVGARIALHSGLRTADALIPVPLHRRKQRERGYNQAELICRSVGKVTGIPIRSSFIIRTKYTQSQTTLTLEERNQNVGDAFSVRASARSEISGKRFILVDDVITTGSTILACAGVLRAIGAEKVYAASVALAQ